MWEYAVWLFWEIQSVSKWLLSGGWWRVRWAGVVDAYRQVLCSITVFANKLASHSLQNEIRCFTPGKVILLDSTLFCRWHWGLVHRLFGGTQQTWQREQEQFWPNRVLLISQLMNLYLLAPNWPWAMPVKAPLWADLWPLGTVKRKESGQS